jgi:hypothetical protein
MIVGIHQPNYLPYLGFFDKLSKSDVFVIYDDADFNKSDFQHRNRIRIYHGSKWLTVPVEKGHIPINQISIKNDVLIGNMKWSDYHFKEIIDNYSKADYYPMYESKLSGIYSDNFDKLIDINLELIYFLANALDIKTNIVLSSEFGCSSKSTEKIVEIVNELNGDTYLSGSAGNNYMDLEQFRKANIEVVFQEFHHPVYKQQYKDFVPYMSALDGLLNMGAGVFSCLGK